MLSEGGVRVCVVVGWPGVWGLAWQREIDLQKISKKFQLLHLHRCD